MPRWRNWQTRTVQGRVRQLTDVGSNPTRGTNLNQNRRVFLFD